MPIAASAAWEKTVTARSRPNADLETERDWQIQLARLHLAAARAKPNRPRWLWLPDFTAGTLRLKASEAVRRARVANHALIALRLMARESLSARISELAHTKSVNHNKEL